MEEIKKYIQKNNELDVQHRITKEYMLIEQINLNNEKLSNINNILVQKI